MLRVKTNASRIIMNNLHEHLGAEAKQEKPTSSNGRMETWYRPKY